MFLGICLGTRSHRMPSRHQNVIMTLRHSKGPACCDFSQRSLMLSQFHASLGTNPTISLSFSVKGPYIPILFSQYVHLFDGRTS